MNKRLSAVTLIAAAPLALTSVFAFAHDTSANADAAKDLQTMRELRAPPQEDVRPFQHAKLSLIQAATDAKKELRGEPLEARFEMWHGQPSYLIRTFTANQVWQERVDANTGEPIGDARAL